MTQRLVSHAGGDIDDESYSFDINRFLIRFILENGRKEDEDEEEWEKEDENEARGVEEGRGEGDGC